MNLSHYLKVDFSHPGWALGLFGQGKRKEVGGRVAAS